MTLKQTMFFAFVFAGFVVFTNSEAGESLGNDLFDLLLGPDPTKLYIIASAIILLIGSGIGYGLNVIVCRV